MTTGRDDERLDRVLERMREESPGPAATPAGGFADVECRFRRRRRVAAARTAFAAIGVVGTLAAGWAILSHWRGDRLPQEQQVATVPPPGGRPAPRPVDRAPAPSPAVRPRVAYVAEPGAEVTRTSETTFDLESGTVWFAVERGAGVRTEVRTPDRIVVVHGTVFAVSVAAADAGGGTRVGVLTGRVEVRSRRQGAPVFVEPGEELGASPDAKRPLDPEWRVRMAALFPERVAAESRAAEVAAAPPAEAQIPSATPPAVAAAVDRPPAADRPRVSAGRSRTVDDLLRAGDAAAAAEALESIARTSQSWAEAGVALMDLGHLCRTRLHDLDRAGAAYERYLGRFPGGALREEARLALCEIRRERGDAAAEAECLEAYLAEFPAGRHAAAARERLGR